VRAEHVTPRRVGSELHETLDAGEVRREVEDVQSPGVQRVTGEQQAGLAVVECDVCGLVAGDRDDVDDPAAEFVLAAPDRPYLKAEPKSRTGPLQ